MHPPGRLWDWHRNVVQSAAVELFNDFVVNIEGVFRVVIEPVGGRLRICRSLLVGLSRGEPQDQEECQ